MFQKDGPFAFHLLSLPLLSSLFLSLPLFVSSSLCLFVSLSFCLFVFLSLCLFVSSSLFLSLPLSSSLFLSFPLFLSFFNVHPAIPANSLKTKDLIKRHFRLKFLSQGKPLRLKTLGENSPNNSSTFPPTLHSTCRRNRPYMLCRETLHYVGFHVGFADPILHTKHC